MMSAIPLSVAQPIWRSVSVTYIRVKRNARPRFRFFQMKRIRLRATSPSLKVEGNSSMDALNL